MSVFLVVGVIAFVLLIAGVSRARRGPLDPEPCRWCSGTEDPDDHDPSCWLA